MRIMYIDPPSLRWFSIKVDIKIHISLTAPRDGRNSIHRLNAFVHLRFPCIPVLDSRIKHAVLLATGLGISLEYVRLLSWRRGATSFHYYIVWYLWAQRTSSPSSNQAKIVTINLNLYGFRQGSIPGPHSDLWRSTRESQALD